MLQCNLVKARGRGADFAGAELGYADFSHADLSAANLTDATLFRTTLHRIRDDGAAFSDRGRALNEDHDLIDAEDWLANHPAPSERIEK
jgi:uncharacterized protein YjbI with pentapeptide repeats